jgi:hypothetical protein
VDVVDDNIVDVDVTDEVEITEVVDDGTDVIDFENEEVVEFTEVVDGIVEDRNDVVPMVVVELLDWVITIAFAVDPLAIRHAAASTSITPNTTRMFNKMLTLDRSRFPSH